MKRLRVLVVEDELLTAMDLEGVINEISPAVVIIKTSIASTKKVLDELFDLAFLDIEVTDGKTFEVAQILEEKNTPVVFVSGTSLEDVPNELRGVPFVRKPFRRVEIQQVLVNGLLS